MQFVGRAGLVWLGLLLVICVSSQSQYDGNTYSIIIVVVVVVVVIVVVVVLFFLVIYVLIILSLTRVSRMVQCDCWNQLDEKQQMGKSYTTPFLSLSSTSLLPPTSFSLSSLPLKFFSFFFSTSFFSLTFLILSLLHFFFFFKLDSVDGQCGPPEWQNLNCDMSRSFVEDLDMVFFFLCFIFFFFFFSEVNVVFEVSNFFFH